MMLIKTPVALHGCETWCLTLREKLKLKVFVNKVERRNIWNKERASGRRLKKTA
jgi:hypothetical protein